MEKTKNTFTKTLFICFIIFTVGMLVVQIARAESADIKPVGTVTFVTGDATITHTDKTVVPAVKNATLNAGDAIETKNGRLQLSLMDGGKVSLQPNTIYKINKYEFSGKEDGSEFAFTELIKGGLRTVSGLIGHKNRDRYQLKTAVATIGIRGTEFTVNFNDNQLLMTTNHGSVDVCNTAGCLNAVIGQTIKIVGLSAAPEYTRETAKAAAAPPASAKVTFTASDEVNEESVPVIVAQSVQRTAAAEQAAALAAQQGADVNAALAADALAAQQAADALVAQQAADALAAQQAVDALAAQQAAATLAAKQAAEALAAQQVADALAAQQAADALAAQQAGALTAQQAADALAAQQAAAAALAALQAADAIAAQQTAAALAAQQAAAALASQQAAAALAAQQTAANALKNTTINGSAMVLAFQQGNAGAENIVYKASNTFDAAGKLTKASSTNLTIQPLTFTSFNNDGIIAWGQAAAGNRSGGGQNYNMDKVDYIAGIAPVTANLTNLRGTYTVFGSTAPFLDLGGTKTQIGSANNTSGTFNFDFAANTYNYNLQVKTDAFTIGFGPLAVPYIAQTFQLANSGAVSLNANNPTFSNAGNLSSITPGTAICLTNCVGALAGGNLVQGAFFGVNGERVGIQYGFTVPSTAGGVIYGGAVLK